MRWPLVCATGCPSRLALSVSAPSLCLRSRFGTAAAILRASRALFRRTRGSPANNWTAYRCPGRWPTATCQDPTPPAGFSPSLRSPWLGRASPGRHPIPTPDRAAFDNSPHDSRSFWRGCAREDRKADGARRAREAPAIPVSIPFSPSLTERNVPIPRAAGRDRTTNSRTKTNTPWAFLGPKLRYLKGFSEDRPVHSV